MVLRSELAKARSVFERVKLTRFWPAYGEVEKVRCRRREKALEKEEEEGEEEEP